MIKIGTRWKKIISLIITLALVALLLTQIDFTQAKDIILKISWPYLLIAFIFYFVGVCLRAWRWQILILSKKVGFLNSLKITLGYTFFCNLLPFRSGELSFVYFIKKRENIAVAEGLSVLLIARFFDLLAVAVSFLAGFILLNPGYIPPNKIYLSCIVLGLGTIAVLFYLDQLIKAAIVLMDKAGLTKFKFGAKLIIKLKEAITSIKAIRSLPVYLINLLISFLWLASASLMVIAFFRSLNIDFGWLKVTLGLIFSQLISFLPVQGLWDFGTYETGWAIGFGLLGLNKEAAIISGFMVHLFSLAYLLILIIIFLPVRSILKKTNL
ncbi:MAG: lysylphosphatidylglycerol synthase transmembrane domain-containing protein [Candidatus Buchananbacteria bacterium]